MTHLMCPDLCQIKALIDRRGLLDIWDQMIQRYVSAITGECNRQDSVSVAIEHLHVEKTAGRY